jgi:hypothetical protein
MVKKKQNLNESLKCMENVDKNLHQNIISAYQSEDGCGENQECNSCCGQHVDKDFATVVLQNLAYNCYIYSSSF